MWPFKKLHFCSNQQQDVIWLVCRYISMTIARKSAKNQFTSKPLPTKHTAIPFKFGSLKLIQSKPIETNRIQTHQAHSQVNERRKKKHTLLFFGYTTKPNSTKLPIFHSLFCVTDYHEKVGRRSKTLLNEQTTVRKHCGSLLNSCALDSISVISSYQINKYTYAYDESERLTCLCCDKW